MKTKDFYKIMCHVKTGTWQWVGKSVPPIGTLIQDFAYGKQPRYYEITGYSIENVRRYWIRRPSLIIHLTEIES